ncbi:MAG: 7-cyano-7-deazaguanine synthase QueC [Thermoguttaceae bacterium]|nr:7-cyano-7-deazaguanine synthase QueC [Thermoguttaceae bacterium]
MASTKAVVLLSGGLDSSTVCALAKSRGRDVFALTINYAQRNVHEIDAAREIAKLNDVAEHVILPIDLSLIGGSSLTDKSIAVAKDVPLEKIGKEIPTSYVPARNTIFLSLALGYAESRDASEIWLGVNQLDYSGYPDCRPEYIDSFKRLAKLATKVGVEGAPIEIQTPLLYLSKAEIIKLGVSLGVDYSKTRTCYDLDENGLACGRCESCLLRKNGFQEAGVPDPTPYRNDA